MVKITSTHIQELLYTTAIAFLGAGNNGKVGIGVRGRFNERFNRVMKDKDGKDVILYGNFIVCGTTIDPKTGFLTLGSID